MEEKKNYRIIDEGYPEDVVYVLLTEAQARAIQYFIEWAVIDYSIKEVGNIVPVEW